MTNTHKLLLALIDALGLEIEEVKADLPITKKHRDMNGQEYDFPVTGQFKSVVIDYKLTKREADKNECMASAIARHTPMHGGMKR